MRTGTLAIVALMAAFALPLAAAQPSPAAVPGEADSCAAFPPCGPITVIIEFVLEKSRGITFGDADTFETKGKVSFYFDIDQEGYWYDPNEEIWIEFGVNKQPPWLRTTFEPTKVQVPYRPQDGCAGCVRQEGSDPQNWQFYWEGDVKVKVEKLRDYAPHELKGWLKADGTYRVTFRGASNDSMAGTDQTGRPAGLTEGYGPKDLRFLPEAVGAPQTGGEPDGLAPGAGLLWVLLLGGLLMARRRQAG